MPKMASLSIVAILAVCILHASPGRAGGNDGSYHTAIHIDVPAFHGIEPSLDVILGGMGNGLAGVGSALTGVSIIERASPGKGTPTYTASDIFLLDGQDLVPCPSTGSSSPSCLTKVPGTAGYFAKIENYTRIGFDGTSWTVTQATGIKSTYAPVLGGFRHVLSSRTDLYGNSVQYKWWCDGSLDCYIDTVTYGGVTVQFYRQSRSDSLIFAMGNALGQMNYLLKSVLVSVGGSNLRAYKFSYTTSPSTGRSLLASLQMYGKDVVIDGSGTITNGTSYPAETYTYTSMVPSSYMNGAGGGTNLATPTACGGFYAADINGDGRSDVIQVPCGYSPTLVIFRANSDGSGYSTTGRIIHPVVPFSEAITSGVIFADLDHDGKAEMIVPFQMVPAPENVSGPVAIFSGSALWANSVPVGATKIPSIAPSSQVTLSSSVTASTLAGAYFTLGDVNGDSYPDLVLFYNGNTTNYVNPASPSVCNLPDSQGCASPGTAGFSVYLYNPTTGGFTTTPSSTGSAGDWSIDIHGRAFNLPSLADINGDGKADLFSHGQIALSNGVGFTSISGTGAGRASPVSHFLTGDFNGDGSSDYAEVYIGYSSGAAIVKCFPSTIDSGVSSVCPTGVTLSLYADTYLSTGRSFVTTPIHSNLGSPPTTTAFTDLSLMTLDTNRDGLADLGLIVGGAKSAYCAATSTKYLFAAPYVPATNPSCGRGGVSFATVNPGLQIFNASASGGFAAGPGVFPAAYGTWQSTQYSIAGVTQTGLRMTGGAQGNIGVVRRGTWSTETINTASVTTVTAAATAPVVLLADFNADGVTDILQVTANMGQVNIGVDNGAAQLYPSDMLASVTNKLGGKTSIVYDLSSNYTSTNATPLTNVVKQIITSPDGGTTRSYQDYSYSGLSFDYADRQSLGFASVTSSALHASGETAPSSVVSYFSQVPGLPALLHDKQLLSSSGRILQDAQEVYTKTDATGKALTAAGGGCTNGSATFPCILHESGRWAYTYDPGGSGTYLRTYVGFAYDTNGNITEQDNYGNCDAAGDETTIKRITLSNTASFVIGLPVQVDTFSGAPSGGACPATGTGSDLLAEQLSYYDGATYASYPSPAGQPKPTIGANTQTLVWDSYYNSYAPTTLAFDANGNLISTTDALGNTSTTVYDSTYHRFAMSTTNALGQTTTAAWDAGCGVQTSITEVNKQTTTKTYDQLCRSLTVSGPLGSFVTSSYYNQGNLATQYTEENTPSADGTGAQWMRHYYDGFGRVWRSISKGPSSAQSIYTDAPTLDARGNPLTTSIPYYAGSSAPAGDSLTYDVMGRVVRTTHADGTYSMSVYAVGAAAGLTMTAATVDNYDELGHRAQTAFDALGRKVSHTEWLGANIATTTYVYDSLNHLTKTTDPMGNVTTVQIDSLGFRHQIVDPDMGTWSHDYDGNGRLISQVDALGHRTEFTYDQLNRKLTKTTCVPAGSPATCSNAGATLVNTVSWGYDQAVSGYFNIGRATSEADALGTFTANYDALGRVVQSIRIIDGVTYTITQGYDAGGRMLWKTLPDGDSFGTAANPLTYDGAGRPNAVPGIVTQAMYDALGRLTQLNNANGSITTYAFDAKRQWMSSLQTTSAAATIQNFGFTYDADGNITKKTSPFSDEQWTYTHDGLHRMTGATNAASATHNQTLTYDILGNITNNSLLGNYSYPAAKAAHPHAATTAGTNTYTYDANGNRLSGPSAGVTYSYDFNNLPTNINGVQFFYDADGKRLKKVNGATTTYYLGDAYEVTNKIATKTFSLGGLSVAQRVGLLTTYWLHNDHQGSINVLTDNTGKEVQRLTYMPFGDLIKKATGVAESLGYTGQRQDETGLHYLHARYYDSQLARFVSPDSVVPHADIVGLNRYAYASNQPINRTDASGHKDCQFVSGVYTGDYCTINASNASLTVWGNFDTINGSNDKIFANNAFITGSHNYIGGSHNFIHGSFDVVVGDFNMLWGDSNATNGDFNRVTGNGNVVIGTNSTVKGYDNWISQGGGNEATGLNNQFLDLQSGTILLTTSGGVPGIGQRWPGQNFQHAAMIWIGYDGVPYVLEKAGWDYKVDQQNLVDWITQHSGVVIRDPITQTPAQMTNAANTMYNWHNHSNLIPKNAIDCSATVGAAYGIDAFGTLHLTPDGLNTWAQSGRLTGFSEYINSLNHPSISINGWTISF